MEASIAAARPALDAQIFRTEVAPTTADEIAAWSHHAGRFVAARFHEGMTDLHGRSLITFPGLAAMCRAREALDDLALAAASLATPSTHLETTAVAQHRAANEARARYKRAIIAQLATCPGHELAAPARALVELDELEARLAIVVARHEAHAVAELARLDAERRAADAAIVDRTAEIVRAAAATAAHAKHESDAAQRAFLVARAEALRVRLRASGQAHLRVGSADGGKLFEIDELIGQAGSLSHEQMAQYEAALAAQEAL